MNRTKNERAPLHLEVMFTWVDILRMALSHTKDFTIANVISVISPLLYLPIPLIIPSLINEVLLKLIYVLSNTKISEQGTHQELLDLKGIYYSLHTLQTK